MFKKLFKKKHEKVKETKKVEPEIVTETKPEVKEFKPVFRFKDTTTGEIHEVAFGDHDKFDEMMDNKNMCLVFG